MAYTKNDEKRSRKQNFWDPFELGNIFNEAFQGPFFDAIKKEFIFSRPSVNVIESTDNYRLELAVPGLEKKDIRIKLDGKALNISASAEHKLEEGEKYNRREFDYSNFQRSIPLPEDVNKSNIKAAFKNGMLLITLSKKAKEGSRNINID